MKSSEMPIAITSTLSEVINNNPTLDGLKILGKVYHVMTTLDDLRRNRGDLYIILSAAYQLIDNTMAKAGQESKISCKKGCAFCCKMNVDVSPLEVDLILDYCKKKNIPIDLDYIQRQSVIAKMEIGRTPGLAACVFLSDQNTCKIYPVRPMACRKYVVTSPAQWCDMAKYPNAKLDGLVDVFAEIVTSAVTNLQKNFVDSLPAMLLKQLKEQLTI